MGSILEPLERYEIKNRGCGLRRSRRRSRAAALLLLLYRHVVPDIWCMFLFSCVLDRSGWWVDYDLAPCGREQGV